MKELRIPLKCIWVCLCTLLSGVFIVRRHCFLPVRTENAAIFIPSCMLYYRYSLILCSSFFASGLVAPPCGSTLVNPSQPSPIVGFSSVFFFFTHVHANFSNFQLPSSLPSPFNLLERAEKPRLHTSSLSQTLPALDFFFFGNVSTSAP